MIIYFLLIYNQPKIFYILINPIAENLNKS